MNVYGELKRAQLELQSSDPTSILGRVYADISTPTAAVPKFYNGTSWKTILTGADASGIVSQNSGKACTVNWASGTKQKVVLTDNAVISFSNPQEGLNHELVITQNLSPVTGVFCYSLNMIDQECGWDPYQPIEMPGNGKSHYYSWLYKTAVTTAYATIKRGAVSYAFPEATDHDGAAFSADGKACATGHDVAPGVDLMFTRRQVNPGDSFLSMRNIITPGTSPIAVNGIWWAPDSRSIYYIGEGSPYVIGAFVWNYTLANGMALMANPATLPTGQTKSMDGHPTGSYLAVGHATTPFMSVYPLTGTGFGAKLSNPATLPVAQVNGIAFAKTGDYLAAASQTTPFIQVWIFDGATSSGSIGLASANPGTLPAGGPAGGLGTGGIAWRPQGDYIAMAMSASPYLYIVAFDRATGTFGASIDCSGAAIGQAANCVRWSPDGQYLIVGTDTGAKSMYVYDFSSFAISGSISSDSGNPTAQVNDIAIHPSGIWCLQALQASPYTSVGVLPNKQRNYLRLTAQMGLID